MSRTLSNVGEPEQLQSLTFLLDLYSRGDGMRSFSWAGSAHNQNIRQPCTSSNDYSEALFNALSVLTKHPLAPAFERFTSQIESFQRAHAVSPPSTIIESPVTQDA